MYVAFNKKGGKVMVVSNIADDLVFDKIGLKKSETDLDCCYETLEDMFAVWSIYRISVWDAFLFGMVSRLKEPDDTFTGLYAWHCMENKDIRRILLKYIGHMLCGRFR